MSFGKKGDYLTKLSKLNSNKFTIPKYLLMSSTVYKKWIENKDINSDLFRYFKETLSQLNIKNGIIVRSSALFSEDNGENTGAGIYESIIIRNFIFDEFKEKIIQIFRSVNSKLAIKYRKENNIEYEEMGIVIQEYKDTNLSGTINSRHFYTENLLSFTINDNYIFLNKKDGNYHIPYDIYKIRGRSFHELDILKLKNKIFKVSNIIETYFGFPVQIEYLTRFFPQNKDIEIQIVQVRPIPFKMLKSNIVTNKRNDEPLFEFNSLGLFDGMLNIKVRESTYEVKINKEITKDELLIFLDGTGASLNYNGISNALLRKGVVLTLGHFQEGHGHIETLAVEKGICILSSKEEFHNAKKISEALKIYEKIYLFSDGISRKIYSPFVNENEIFSEIIQFMNTNDYSFVNLGDFFFIKTISSKFDLTGNSLYLILELMVRKKILKKEKSNAPIFYEIGNEDLDATIYKLI